MDDGRLEQHHELALLRNLVDVPKSSANERGAAETRYLVASFRLDMPHQPAERHDLPVLRPDHGVGLADLVAHERDHEGAEGSEIEGRQVLGDARDRGPDVQDDAAVLADSRRYVEGDS